MLFSIPDHLPPDGVEVQTGIACPECAGTLVMLLRRDLPMFRCRISHVYSLPELLAAQEEMLERRLWDAVSSMEEFCDVLEDAARCRFAHVDREWYRRRSAAARDHAGKLRSIIAAERPLRMDGAAESAPDPPGAVA